jgi:hypothetical protein
MRLWRRKNEKPEKYYRYNSLTQPTMGINKYIRK